MEKEYHISIYLDTRRAKANGKFPVKLRVFTTLPRKQKLYPTVFDYTEKEFTSIWTTRPRAEYKEAKLELQALENEANDTAKELKPFSFEQFEKKHFRNTGEGQNVIYQYDQIISKLKANGQLGTASNYELSKKSLLSFIKDTKGKEPRQISFSEIDALWLTRYESYMIKEKERSRTTVSMYLRALRTVFNTAISENEISKEYYPFGKNSYQVPAVKSVKKALTKEQLRILFDAKPKTVEQAKARDFWFFSFICNGMNIKDIALLRYEDINGDNLVFYRAKTLTTSKADLKPIQVHLTPFAKYVIKEYGNRKTTPKQFIFPIITDKLTELEKHTSVKNFTRFINQNLKKLATIEGITEDISTYWARHSFATTAIRKGASMEFVSEALNHQNMKTTQGYFAGFADNDKKEFMEKLMDF